MEETFTMKLILLWIGLISEAFPLPTQSPPDITNAGCEESPKVGGPRISILCCLRTRRKYNYVYRGHDSKSGINVYVFEFLPQSREAKDNRFDETTMKNGLQGDRNGLNGKENGESYEDTFIPTNKPASIYSKKKESEKETNTRDNTHTLDLKIDTINRTIDTTQNDIALHEDTDLLSNATKELQTGMSQTRDMQKTGRHGNGNDYYGTEGSALLDIPGYTDTDTAKHSPTVDFPGSVNNVSNSFVTQPTQKDNSKRGRHGPDGFANSEGNAKNRTVTQRIVPTKTEKHKSEKKTAHDANTKNIPTRANAGKRFQYHRVQRRKMGGKRHYYRHSSSESSSESSQEFD